MRIGNEEYSVRICGFWIILMMVCAVGADVIGDTVTVNGNNGDVIVLDHNDFDDEENVLTVRHKTVSPLYPSVRVIKASEFKGKFADLPSVVETVSGVDVRSTGGYGQYAESIIRGGTAKGLRVYLDGILLTGATGAVDLGKIPLDRIREIRVTKSVSELRQMGSGMGGVIELFTDDSENGANKNITGINIETGSFGYLRGGVIIKRNQHQLNIDISKSENDYPFTHDNGTTISTIRDPDPTWDDTRMRKKNNHYGSIDAAYGLGIDINGNHKITQQLSAGFFEQGLFAYHYGEDQSGSTSGATVIYGADYNGEINGRLNISGEASGIYRHNIIRDPNGRFSLGGTGKELVSDGVSLDFSTNAKYALADNFRLSGLAGTRFERYVRQNRVLNNRPAMNRYEYRLGAEADLSVDIGESITTGSVLRAVYKYETDTSTAGLGYSYSESQRNAFGYPAAEAVFNIGMKPVNIQLSASASKRSPTFFERFGWSGGFLSNPNLREESRIETDMGISIDIGEWSASASVFAGKANDKIKSIPRNGLIMVMNFADTDFYGAEADINAQITQFVTVGLSASYLNSIISGATDPSWIGKTEPFVPSLSGYVKTEFDFWKVNVGHGIKYEGECYLSIENIGKKSPQTELSAWVSYKTTDELTLRYRVDNYANRANFDFLDNPMPRRTHIFSANFNF